MVAVNIDDLRGAFEFVSASGGYVTAEAYISLDTGKIYWVGDDLPEEDELPDDLQTSDRYLAVPNRNDLDLGVRSSSMVGLSVVFANRSGSLVATMAECASLFRPT